MSYDTLTDAVVDAVRAIATQKVNAALTGTLTSAFPAIESTSGYPTPLEGIEGMKLPALFVYIDKEDPFQDFRENDTRLSVVLEYLGPATPVGKLGARWPLLRRVWRELKHAIDAGLLDSGSGNVDALTPIGVFQADEDLASVQYRFASDGENAYPAFVGRFPVSWRDPADPAAALSLLKLYADINRVEDNPALPPSVQVIRNA